MKNLVALFSSLIIVGLIASCSTSTGVDDFEQKKFGNWLLVADTQANYIGSRTPAKMKSNDADTLYINSNERIDLKLVDLQSKRGASNYFDVIFVDSQYVYNRDLDYDFDAWANDMLFFAGGGSYTLGDFGFSTSIQSQYACAEDDYQFNDMNIAIYTDGELDKLYVIDIDGMRETLDEMFSCY